MTAGGAIEVKRNASMEIAVETVAKTTAAKRVGK